MKLVLDHVAVAVSDIVAAVADFESGLGIPCDRVETVESEGAKVAFFDLGGAHLELVAPANPKGAIARSLEKRGEGLHHIALLVEDIDRVLLALQKKGVKLVNNTATPGAGGSRVAFIHPQAMHGVLVELVEKPRSAC